MKPTQQETSPTPVPLSYATPEQRRRWPFRLLTFSAIGLFLVFAASVVMPAINPPRSQHPRVKCSSNMRQIGLAIVMYANEHGGAFPENLHEILEKEDITAEVFVCPSSNDTRAVGPTTRAVLDEFDTPGHCSYIYLGKGLDDKCDPQTPVLYEPPSIHHGGMNVLFADGHVEYFSGTDAPTILNATAVRSKLNE